MAKDKRLNLEAKLAAAISDKRLRSSEDDMKDLPRGAAFVTLSLCADCEGTGSLLSQRHTKDGEE